MCRFSIAHEKVLLQVSQLSALAIRVPATRGEKFILNFDWVAIKEGEVRGVLLSAQSFVHSLHFTQRSFSLSLV